MQPFSPFLFALGNPEGPNLLLRKLSDEITADLRANGTQLRSEGIGLVETWCAQTALSEGMLLVDTRGTSATCVWNSLDTSGSTQVG